MKRYLTSCGTIVVAALLLAAFSTTLVAAEKFVLRVNAGGDKEYTDKAGNVWKADKEYSKGSGYGFVGGKTVDRGTDMKIAGSPDARIYQTEHYRMESFKAEVPDGNYTVRLHFAETYHGVSGDGQRVFDVKLQGKEILKDFDVRKTAGANEKAVVKEFKGIEVTGGLLAIDFIQKTQSPQINGIEIIAE